jgi:hypothetical protein
LNTLVRNRLISAASLAGTSNKQNTSFKGMDRVGFEKLLSIDSLLNEKVELRSWVQIRPPGPLLSAREIRYCSELDFGLLEDKFSGNTNAIPYPFSYI